MPKSVRFAFLSATIPNAAEFAQWIAKTHRQGIDRHLSSNKASASAQIATSTWRDCNPTQCLSISFCRSLQNLSALCLTGILQLGYMLPQIRVQSAIQCTGILEKYYGPGHPFLLGLRFRIALLKEGMASAGLLVMWCIQTSGRLLCNTTSSQQMVMASIWWWMRRARSRKTPSRKQWQP